MLKRLDAMDAELGTLIDSLRTGSNRLNADLQLLESSLSETAEAVIPRQRFEPELDPEPELEPLAPAETEPEPESATEPDSESEPEMTSAGDGRAAAGRKRAGEDGSEPLELSGATDDAEGARLIALNMALNGTPRAETAQYLSENFQLSDRDALLDEVYASVEG
jgi:hypothetical protein